MPMKSLDEHLKILQEVLTERSPLTWDELAAKVLARAAERKLETSEMLVARLAIAALANLEPANTAFPEIQKVLVLLADGRFKLKS